MVTRALRCDVLAAFKKLHRTRQKVFDEDIPTLTAAREKINEGFRKNKGVADEAAVKEFAHDVEREMRTTIIQAREVEPGKFVARITDDTVKLDNIEFDLSKCPDPKPRKKPPSCCQDGSAQ